MFSHCIYPENKDSKVVSHSYRCKPINAVKVAESLNSHNHVISKVNPAIHGSLYFAIWKWKVVKIKCQQPLDYSNSFLVSFLFTVVLGLTVQLSVLRVAGRYSTVAGGR